MDKKLYKIMEWGKVEGIVYADEAKPHEILGGHYIKGGILIQAFYPEAASVTAVVQISRKIQEYPLELVDEAGFFAALVRTEKQVKFNYCFKVTDKEGRVTEVYDPYSFAPTISEKEIAAFEEGKGDGLYRLFGAHVKEIDGISGTSFAVWAPNAVGASVVGDFNNWDDRVHQMRKLYGKGVFEIFVPGVKEGALYKFELRLKGGVKRLKADPFTFIREEGSEGASIVAGKEAELKDEKWLSNRKKTSRQRMPFSILEADPFLFREKLSEEKRTDPEAFAALLVDYAKDMGYTHVELPAEGGLFAPCGGQGSSEALLRLIGLLHAEGLGVILDLDFSGFPKDAEGLYEFDGTCLFGHMELKKRYNGSGSLRYNYARGEVSAYLIAAALYRLDVFHADGLRLTGLDEMIYLDFGKKKGEWIANEYGGKEDIAAIDFIKRLNSVIEERKDGTVTIAEGLSTWAKVTAPVEKDGLGFFCKWDLGFTSDVLDFIGFDPFFRTHHYGELAYSLSYFDSERFLLPFSRKSLWKEGDQTPLLSKLPGGRENKLANLRAALGYLYTHPGLKLNCLTEKLALDPETAETEAGKKLAAYMKAILHFYTEHPALYEYDGSEKGFEWINHNSANENIIAFLRKGEKETLLVLLNFANVVFTDWKLGVPFAGKYKEIFNSDAENFGGAGNVNPRVKTAKKEECDGREHSIKVKAAPLSVTIFRCEK
ncbi:MAG: 1,4-alpha-glucan branching enzyme [Lachnospiraceae bacterium]|nr:1,4-alpha-glucan branching enzyme [Lachnospiraceae bacterium]